MGVFLYLLQKNSVSRWEIFQKINKCAGPNKTVGKKNPKKKNKKCNTLIRKLEIKPCGLGSRTGDVCS